MSLHTAIRPGRTWLTPDQAAHRIGRTRKTINRWQRAGRITVHLGLIDEHQLLAAQAAIVQETRARARRNLQATPHVSHPDPIVGSPRPPSEA